MKYGVYDTKDNCWIGDSKGPKLFENENLAMVAARIVDVQLRNTPGRCKALPFGEEPVFKKDELKTHMTAEAALQRLEDGRSI
jgi:hypothetical protein